jgi:cytoskeleton protein RodZ
MASLGQALRDEREARNISIEEIANSTKIGSRYLEALEADRLDQMPGGFFIRGIIRSYAKAIGLDPEEVLDRYKAAGLVGTAPAETKEQPTAAPEAAPSEEIIESPVKPAPDKPPAVEPAAPAIQFEEAPRPRISAAARKRIAAWTLGVLAVFIVTAVIVTVWPSRRTGGEGTKTRAVSTEAIPPPARTVAAEEAPAAFPPVEEIGEGLTIEISFHAETWIQVRTDGELKITGLFPPGSTARAQAENELFIHTGNARGFSFLLNGHPAKPLGRPGAYMLDVKITPENMKDFLERPGP